MTKRKIIKGWLPVSLKKVNKGESSHTNWIITLCGLLEEAKFQVEGPYHDRGFAKDVYNIHNSEQCINATLITSCTTHTTFSVTIIGSPDCQDLVSKVLQLEEIETTHHCDAYWCVYR